MQIILGILILLLYLASLGLTLLIFSPLLSIPSKRATAQKVIGTVFLSLPCLTITLICYSIVFILPGLLFLYLISLMTDPPIIIIVLTSVIFVLFFICIAASSIYLWFLTCKLLYQRIDRKPLSEVLNNDKILNYIKPYIYKLRFIPIDKIIDMVMKTLKFS